MNFLSVKSRITLGLVSMLVSMMMLAIFLGIGPDSHQATTKGRASLCESIALNFSILVQRGDISSTEGILKALVERNDELLSAGIRRANGTMLFVTGDHNENWVAKTGYSTETQVQVPIRNADSLWGNVELRFRPIQQEGIVGYLKTPWVQYTSLVCVLSFFAFYFYLGRVLKQLDPSNAIPKRVRAALDTLAEGLLVTDKKGRVVLANESFARWVGKDAEKLMGQDASGFSWFVDSSENTDKRFPWTRAIEDALAQAQVYLQLTDKDNRVLTLVANSSPVLGQDGKYRGVLTSFEDITELQQHKVELSEAKDVADAANRAKSDFLARMSHEIRTPMNAILGFTEILQNGLANNENQRQDYLQTIQNSGEHLLTLINDILDLSKIESGKMDLELASNSPQEIISQALSIFQLKAEEKGVELSYHAKTWLPETILTDSVRLRQVIINLVGNALKFTEKGSVQIHSRMTEGPHPLLAIDIVDTGIGVSPEGLSKIFEPFSQEDTSITRRFGGTGLGLSICLFLAEKMGGSVTATSVKDEGSVFTVTIDPGPLDKIRRIQPTEIESERRVNSERRESIRLRPCHILVVDDGAANRQLVTVYLERAGAKVTCAENGKVALDTIAKSSFDLVLMDVHMPVMDGLCAARQMRANGLTLPIIALTGNVMKDDENSCRAAGYSGFLTKPISMQRLLTAVAKAIGEIKSLEVEKIVLGHPSNDRNNDRLSTSVATGQASLSNDESTLLSEVHQSIMQISAFTEDPSIIVSDLPTEDEEICGIVQDFVVHLRLRIELIEQTVMHEDFKELEELAHWLKGAAGSLGFRPFTIPARDLETAAAARNGSVAREQVLKIRSLLNRVRGPRESQLAQSL